MPTCWRRCRNCAGRFLTWWCSLSGKAGRRRSFCDRPGTGIGEQVRFLDTGGMFQKFKDRALDIFVQPSLWEGMPLALLKAMGAGLPVIATRVSGCVDAVMDGERQVGGTR